MNIESVMRMRKTKIVCTLGPATDDESIVRNMMQFGMDVARFNFSHQDHACHKKRFEMVVRLRDELALPIATLLDTRGPEVRVCSFKSGKVLLKAGDPFTLTTREVEGDETIVSITYKDLPADVHKGDRILIDDGLIELKVDNTGDTDILCTVINGGAVSNSKGVNIPGVKLSMPYLSERDIDDLLFGIETGFDFVAASFVTSADDIRAIRKLLEQNGGGNMKIIAKIENSEGVDNIDDIIRVADGIMVARGDMGVEIPFEQIPHLQKQIIKKAYRAGKQVITATQMLDSMMKNPRPTRAETTDVANAIYDGTSAIMLSGETAAGLYPLESVKTMDTIARQTESDIDYLHTFKDLDISNTPNVGNAISHATVTTAHDMGAAAIVTVTKSGATARMISRFRPQCPIISCTTSKEIARQMNLSWGVTPLVIAEETNTDDLFQHAVDAAEAHHLVQSGDLVVITAGVPLGISGTTNLLKVHVVGGILVTGTGVTNQVVCGNLCVCHNEAEALENFKLGDILVIPETSNRIMDLMRSASGIITEVDGIDSHAAVVGLTLEIPVIVGAKYATRILKSGINATLNAERGFVSSNNQNECPIPRNKK